MDETAIAILVALLGFSGVIITLLTNAWFFRGQRTDERRHEQQSIRRALLAELKNIRLGPSEHNKLGEAFKENQDGAVHREQIDDVYRSLLPKIGLLEPDEVDDVVTAYLGHQTYQANLRLIGRVDPALNDHVIVNNEHLPALAEMQKSVLTQIDEAISSLQSEFKK